MAGRRSSLRFRLADELRGRIRSGDLSPGDRLPAEPELARGLGVSRSSVRAAMSLLEEDGFVRRRHGSGTYVTHRPVVNDLGRNFGVTSLIAATGLEPGVVEASSGTEPASAEIAAALRVDPGRPVSVLRRVRTASGRRVVDSADWCRAEDMDPDDLGRLAEGSIYAALAGRGLPVHHGVAWITPTSADAEIAGRLRIARGALLLTISQVDETANGRPVLVSREHHLADAFDICVYRRGPGGDEEEGSR
jgi:DNA-binding GntR family transcriptional regulator